MEEDIHDSIFNEYERVVVQALITSFGLDALIQDQHGGDVDTVHNVRKIGDDPDMSYKDIHNAESYANRGEYDSPSYHSDSQFSSMKHNARERWQETGQNITDTYTGGSIGFGHAKSIPTTQKAELDHVVECKAIHDDRGRVLAGLKGEDLANNPDNLVFTNEKLNKSIGKWAEQENERYKKRYGCDAPIDKVDMKAYIVAHPDLDAQTKERMLAQYEKSRKTYERTINRKYYTSTPFLKSSLKASTTLAIKMGARQALGLVFAEIWFAVKEKMQQQDVNTPQTFLNTIGKGIQEGLQRAKEKHKELWDRFIEGALAGVLSSIITTLTNIFFTTAKNLIRIIRQTGASLVEALKVLLVNPDDFLFGDRMRAASKIIATGASVAVGIVFGKIVADIGVKEIPIPELGEVITTFCSVLVTGLMSCSLLYYLDHNPFINKIVQKLNAISNIDKEISYYNYKGELLERYCAKLMQIDIKTLRSQIEVYNQVVVRLGRVQTQEELNVVLCGVYEQLGLPSPYGKYNNIGAFMKDKNSCLTFK